MLGDKVMSEWRECKLGDVADLINGFAFNSTDFSNSGMPVVKIKNIASGKLVFNDIQYYSHDISSRLKQFILRNGDILIAMTGSHVHQPSSMVGKVTRYDKPFPALLNQRVGKIVSNDLNILSEDFVYYFMTQENITIDLATNAGGSANQANISSEQIRNLLLYLPPLPEQRAIARVLSSLDDKIDLLYQQNKTLEKMAEALWRKIFVEEADPGWEETPFPEYFDFLEGPGIRNWQYTLTGTPFINIRLINNGEIDITKANFVSNEDARTKYRHFLLQEDDIVVSTSGTLGKTAIVRNYHLPLMLNTSVIRFRPKDKRNYSFVYQYLKSIEFRNHLEEAATGSVQSNFGPIHLKQIKFSKPPEEILQRYSAKADNIYHKIKINYLQIYNLSCMRDTLLPRLMSGEVRVRL